MPTFARVALIVLGLLAAADASAAQFGNRTAPRTSWHHGHGRVFIGGWYFGAPYWPYYYGGPYYGRPYYYGPTYEATSLPPELYIEKFDGTPGSDVGELYCPALAGHYPDVQDCPNGWQRIIRPPDDD
jgi:hypothetical protein